MAQLVDGIMHWTAEDVARNLRHPDGRPAFNSAATARSWIARHRKSGTLTHHPTARSGPRDARLYPSSDVLGAWAGKTAVAPRADQA